MRTVSSQIGKGEGPGEAQGQHTVQEELAAAKRADKSEGKMDNTPISSTVVRRGQIHHPRG